MKDKVLKRLNKLHQVDVDAIHAYKEAIDRIDNYRIREQLKDFKLEHERHLDDLERLIQSKGGEVPSRKRDVKGVLINGMTVLRSSVGDEQALKAMRQIGEFTNKHYFEAVKELNQDEECMRVIEKNFADEKRHFTFIKETLEFPHHLDSDDGPHEASPGM
ncbi:MAG: ferritin [Halobacteriovoraceae bacterium]|nr:ferritin [Halobacteriovoraceae bacterium]|tara:strand:+ start:44847 stop:45329 length:483 start_codon:yes stop_codon:yes gene_type:complete